MSDDTKRFSYERWVAFDLSERGTDQSVLSIWHDGKLIHSGEVPRRLNVSFPAVISPLANSLPSFLTSVAVVRKPAVKR
jgi:hypothetical protein